MAVRLCDTEMVGPEPEILISAGEASGDRYAAGLVEALRARYPEARFFGCAGVEMRAAGVEAVVEAESLAVVGIVEVLHHIPRIYGEYRQLLAAARRRRPAFAVLTDSPDFHLRVAKKLRGMGIPVFYLVAPQAWAWREGRVKQIRRNVRQLHCIFPFEEPFFRRRGVEAFYIGHPLARLVRPGEDRGAFFRRLGLDPERKLVTLCPGSRQGEMERHRPVVKEAAAALAREHGAQFALAVPRGAAARLGEECLNRWRDGVPLKVAEGAAWEALAHADVSLVASGTVTVEAALLGAPMVTFYRVSPLTYWAGRPLVNVPHFSMVNLVAGRRLVPECIQGGCTARALSSEAGRLLTDAEARRRQTEGLREAAASLAAGEGPFERSAGLIAEEMERGSKRP